MFLPSAEALRKAISESTPSPSTGGRYVVIDIEATSLDTAAARVMEIGAAVVDDGKVSIALSQLIDPQEPIPEKVTEITGITADMVNGQPTFKDVFPQLVVLIGSSPVVCHNARYDISVLKAEAMRIGKPFTPVVYDTLVLARQRMKGMPNYKLGTLCAATDIDLSNAHRAANDAEATGKLFVKLISRC